MTEIDAIRQKATFSLIVFLSLHIPIVTAVAWMNGAPMITPTAVTAIIVAALWVSWRTSGSGAGTRYAVAVAAAYMPAIIVFLMAGHPWQIDMHMYFFAILAILAPLCDWRAILVCAGAIAVHHLSLNFIMPAAVFPDGASLIRVIVHAVIVVVETGALLWISLRLVAALRHSASAVAAAESAKAEADEVRKQQQEAEQRAAVERQAALHDFADKFEAEALAIMDELTQQITTIEQEGQSMRQVSEETRQEVDTIRGSATSSSTNVQTVASASEELRASIREIAQQASQVSSTISSSANKANTADQEVRSLAESVEAIGGIVTLIQEIAEQTNLLALNATIEAARAGDAGKGFAVVANEVKALANQTRQATEQIITNISELEQRSASAVKSIGEVTADMNAIEQSITTVSAAIEEQEASTSEISESVDRAASGVESVSSSIEQLSVVASNADNAASAVVGTLSRLSSQSGQLSSSVRGFLNSVRAS
ncbi:MAG: methyl-accepting chemotaxis protein [Rhodospirillales bacterium]